MAAAHQQEVGHPVSAPVLHLRGQLDRKSVRAARRGHRIRPLSGQKQPPTGDAAPALCAHTSRPEVPADVSIQGDLQKIMIFM